MLFTQTVQCIVAYPKAAVNAPHSKTLREG